MAIGRAASDILIRIRGDNKEFDQSLKNSKYSMDSFASGISAQSALIGSAIAGIGIAAVGSSIQSAMATEQLERGFKNLATSQGKSADEYILKLKQMSRGTISEADIMRKANQAMLLGIDMDTIVRMMEGAAVIAQATGQDVGYMFESLALGVGRQSRMLLDNLGIIVKVEEANQAYATALGKTVSELTDAEKKTAFLDATMKGLAERTDALGGFVDDTASKWQRFNAQIEDSKALLGEEFLPAASEGLTKINNALVLSTEGHSKILELTAKQNKTIQEQILLNVLLSDAKNKEKVAALDAYNLFNDSTKILEVSADETSRMTDAEWKKAEAIYTALGYSKEYLDTLRAQTEETKKQTDEMKTQLSLMDRFTAKQRSSPVSARRGAGRTATMSAETAKILGYGSERVDARISTRSGL